MTPASSATPRTSPFGAAAVDDEAHRLGRHRDGRLGDGPPGRHRLGRDVDHPRPPGPVDVGEAAALGARRERSRWSIAAEDSAGSQPRRAGQARSSHQSSTSAPAGSASAASGIDRERVRRGEGREDVAPLPGRAAGQRTRTRPCSSRTGAPVGVPLRDDAHERPPARRSSVTGVAQDGPVDGPEEASSRRPARRRIAGRTNSSNVTKRRDRVAGQPEEQGRAAGRSRRRRALGRPERERLAGLDRDPPQLDRCRSPRTPPGRRRTARPTRRPTR